MIVFLFPKMQTKRLRDWWGSCWCLASVVATAVDLREREFEKLIKMQLKHHGCMMNVSYRPRACVLTCCIRNAFIESSQRKLHFNAVHLYWRCKRKALPGRNLSSYLVSLSRPRVFSSIVYHHLLLFSTAAISATS